MRDASSRSPGMRRLQTRHEIRNLRDGQLGSILQTRLKSSLYEGRTVLGEQPAELLTGISVEEERERVDIVERHFSFAPLDITDVGQRIGRYRVDSSGLRPCDFAALPLLQLW